jgi:hypothetical protein
LAASFFVQAKEIHVHNPWLTYGIGLHRMREAGLSTNIMDYIYERPLSLNEVYEWCMDFFVGDSSTPMRHPSKDWDGFVADLVEFLRREKLVWNPIKDKLCPWINVGVLESIYHKNAPGPSKSSATKPANTPNQPEHRRRVTVTDADQPTTHLKSNSFQGVSEKLPRRRVTVSDASCPSIDRSKSTSFQEASGKNAFRRCSTDPPTDDNSNSRKAQSFYVPKKKNRPQSPDEPAVSPESVPAKSKFNVMHRRSSGGETYAIHSMVVY